jgi:hypothetical protein
VRSSLDELLAAVDVVRRAGVFSSVQRYCIAEAD